MHTNFSHEQLQDPTIARADAMLKRCIHCGFCTATCPTYVLLGDERDSPRDGVVEMRHSGRLEEAKARNVLISSQKTRLRALSSSTEGE